MLLGHCDAEGRNYNAIERTSIISPLLARDAASLAAKGERLAVPATYYGFAGTASQVTGLVGAYRDAGVEQWISSAYRNDAEAHELLAADVMPHFA